MTFYKVFSVWKTKLPVHVAEDPLRAVVRGTGTALKNTDTDLKSL